MPVRCGNEPIGACRVHFSHDFALAPWEEEFVEDIAGRVAIALVKLEEQRQIEAAAIEAAKLSDLALMASGVAHTVEDARAKLLSDLFDVVVVDWILPGGHGRQVVELVERWYPETAIVVHSAYQTTDAECTASGVHQFVEKGTSTEPVRNAVERGVHLAQAKRRQGGKAACRACLDERPLGEAVLGIAQIAPREGHFGLVAVPYGLPHGLLLWLAGCHEENAGPVRTLDCAEAAPEPFEEKLFGLVELRAAEISGLGRQAIYQHLRRYGLDRSRFEPASGGGQAPEPPEASSR